MSTEREAFEAWFAENKQPSYLSAWSAWQAALAQPAAPVKVCRGIPRVGCNYLTECDSVCNKCGEVHDWVHIQPWPAQPAVPEPVAWMLGHRFYFDVREADFDWRNDPQFDNTGYAPTPLYAHPPSQPPREPAIAAQAAVLARMRARIESLRGLCKSAVGMLHDAGRDADADRVHALIGDMEPPNVC